MVPKRVSREQRTKCLRAALGDDTSSQLLLALDPAPRTVHELVRLLDLPQSTVYYKLGRLQHCGLVAVVYSSGPNLKRVEAFKSMVSTVEIEFHQGKLDVIAHYRRRGRAPAPS